MDIHLFDFISINRHNLDKPSLRQSNTRRTLTF